MTDDGVNDRSRIWSDIVLDRVRALHERVKEPPSPRVRRALLGLAATVFFGGGYLALRSLDVDLGDVRWVPLLLAAFVGVPLTSVANTGEYIVSARIVGHRVGFLEALRVNVLSTAANLLPVPGAAMVRIQALRQKGTGYGKAASSTAVVGAGWVAVSAWLAGGWLVFADRGITGAVFLLAGSLTGAISYALLRKHVPDRTHRDRLMIVVLAVESLAVILNALRLVLIFYGLGVEATFAQAFVLAISSSLSSLAGVLPGGFGLREAIAAVLSPLVGLPPSAGFATTAVNRVLGTVVHAPFTAALAFGPMEPSDSTGYEIPHDGSSKVEREEGERTMRIERKGTSS